LRNGLFVSDAPQHGYYIHTEESKVFNNMLQLNFDEIENLKLKREERQYFLEKIVEFYRLHIEGMGIVKSLSIFKEVFD
jgi:DNA repair protein RecO (recombination protein O)